MDFLEVAWSTDRGRISIPAPNCACVVSGDSSPAEGLKQWVGLSSPTHGFSPRTTLKILIRGRIMHSSRLNDGDKKMDELYAINAAKSEFRDSFNFSDPSRFLAIADPELVSFSDGQPSEFGESGLESLKTRLENLFQHFTARLAVIVNEIRLQGDVAYDYGCHELTLTPKQGGEPVRRRNRYVDIWRRNKEGEWKLWMYIDNLDVADPFQPEATLPMQRDATAA
jgi:ketosteroid isomerase-like protein